MITLDVELLDQDTDDPYAPLARLSGETMIAHVYQGFDGSVGPDGMHGYIVGWQEWETLRALERKVSEMAARAESLARMMGIIAEEIADPNDLFLNGAPFRDVLLFAAPGDDEEPQP